MKKLLLLLCFLVTLKCGYAQKNIKSDMIFKLSVDSSILVKLDTINNSIKQSKPLPINAEDNKLDWEMLGVIVAFIALLFTIWSFIVTLTRTDKSLELTRNSLNATTFMDIYNEWMGLLDDRNFVFEQLEIEYPQKAEKKYGYQNIDLKEHKDIVRRLSSFFDRLGLMVVNESLDKDLIISFLGTRISQSWEILEPYIMEERNLRRINNNDTNRFKNRGSWDSGDFQEHFKILAILASKQTQNESLDKHIAKFKIQNNLPSDF